jgi:hypothetical protein
MVIHENCVICQKPLTAGQANGGSQLCGAMTCESALSHHLNRKLACCSACGRPTSSFRYSANVAFFCQRFECECQSSSIRDPDSIFCCICGIHVGYASDDGCEDLCQSPFCQRKASSNASRAKADARAIDRENRSQQLVELVRTRSKDLLPESSIGKSLRILVLPFLEHDLSPPSTERLGRVESRFLSLAKEAFELNRASTVQQTQLSESAPSDEPTIAEPDASAIDHRFARWNGAACGTCGGKCCNLGGDDAFLNTDKFRQRLLALPGASPEDIVAEYMSKVPSETFQDSCIFHGIEGCGLNHEQRAVTCNTYLCSSLQELSNSMDDSSEFLMAATNFRDVKDPELKIYRIKHVHERSETAILTHANDRHKLDGVD